jgi:hypothetical protein
LDFKANSLQSYFIYLKIGLPDINLWVENYYDLKDPEFRGFSSYYATSQVHRTNENPSKDDTHK